MSEQQGLETAHLGQRIRASRTRSGLSVRELARRVSVSPSHVSQVERGMASFSVPTLYAVVEQLDVSMDDLFDRLGPIETAEGDENQASSPDNGSGRPGSARGHLDDKGIVQRREDRPTINLSAGLRWQRLTAKPDDDTEFLEVHYEPGGGSAGGDPFIRHTGYEYGVVIEGRLTVQIGFDETVLETGDTASFDSSIPHRYWNAGVVPARAIWFVRGQADGSLSDHFQS
jgi:transcriptional regulator with XRE-family HTH domain